MTSLSRASLSLLLLSAGLSAACDLDVLEGNGERAEESYEVADTATAVENRTQLGVFITIGDSPGAVVIGDSNLVEHITVKVKDDVVIIDDDLDEKTIMDPELKLTAEIEVLSLEAVNLAGVGSLDVVDEWAFETPSVSLEGTGHVRALRIEATDTQVSFEGTGELDVAGTTDTLDLVAEGTGEVDASDLVARAVTLDKSGTGELSVHATESVSGEASGTGEVTVFGDPSERDLEMSGTGELNYE